MHQLYCGLLIVVFGIFWCLLSDRGQTKRLLKTVSVVGWTLKFVWDVYMYLPAMWLALGLLWWFPCQMAFGIPMNSLEFLGIKVWIFTVNLDWEFLGIPRNSQP